MGNNRHRRLVFVTFLTVFGMLLGQFAAAQDATPDTSPVASPASAEDAAPVLLFASDGMRPDLVERYSADGVTPTFAGMVEGGVTGENGQVPVVPTEHRDRLGNALDRHVAG